MSCAGAGQVKSSIVLCIPAAAFAFVAALGAWAGSQSQSQSHSRSQNPSLGVGRGIYYECSKTSSDSKCISCPLCPELKEQSHRPRRIAEQFSGRILARVLAPNSRLVVVKFHLWTFVERPSRWLLSPFGQLAAVFIANWNRNKVFACHTKRSLQLEMGTECPVAFPPAYFGHTQ